MGDTVYGYDELPLWLEQQQKNYVLAVPETHQVWVQGQPQPVGLLAALLPEEAWVVLSAGEGSKGPRRDAWAWLQLPDEMEAASERARWVLIRRSLSDRSERVRLSRVWSGHDHFGPGRAGGEQSASRSKRAMNKPRVKWGWISMKCAPGGPGTAT